MNFKVILSIHSVLNQKEWVVVRESSHFISKILHFSSTLKNGIYLVLLFLRLQNRNRGLRASFCYASLFYKSLLDLLKSKAKEIHEVYAGENNSLRFTPFLSHLFLGGFISLTVYSHFIIFYYRTCINFEFFFCRDISFWFM